MLAAVPAALLFATPAHAGAPPVSARAFLIENPATGEILAQHGAWARAPIASITKLMTVLVTLDHARWNDVVRVRSAAAAVGESTVNLRAGERITVGDLVKAALIQSANDAADALADYVSHGDREAFVALRTLPALESIVALGPGTAIVALRAAVALESVVAGRAVVPVRPV